MQDLAYDWDKAGNLLQRQDLRQALVEAFHYDDLDRMDSSTLNGTQNLSLTYDAIGNITYKSDVGSYSYHPTKVHAVTSAGSNNFTYNLNGNAVTRNGVSVLWTSYNLPSIINAPDGSNSGFSYTHDRQLGKQNAYFGGTLETTFYVGRILEKVVLGGVASWRHHVFAEGRAVAIYTRKSSGANEASWHFHARKGIGLRGVGICRGFSAGVRVI